MSTRRHWKCKLGYHIWGGFYIERLSETFGWMCHKRDCTRAECKQVQVWTHTPEGEITYRPDPPDRYAYLRVVR